MNKRTLVIRGGSALVLLGALSYFMPDNEEQTDLTTIQAPEVESQSEPTDLLKPLPPVSERKIVTTQDLIEEGQNKEIISLDEKYDAKAEAWAKVDLEGMQREMPNNTFWVMAAPTTDEQVLEERERLREHWETLKNKITFNRASEEEIRTYFSEQEQISTDYVEFTTALINRYRDVLPEEDVGLQNVARSMHMTKLQEYPQQMTRALERLEFTRAKQADWENDKSAYQAKLEAQAAEANRALGKI